MSGDEEQRVEQQWAKYVRISGSNRIDLPELIRTVGSRENVVVIHPRKAEHELGDPRQVEATSKEATGAADVEVN